MYMVSNISLKRIFEISGIGPDSKHAIEQGDSSEQEKKSVREALISAYDKNISTRLKTELCSSDTNNYSYAKDVSTSKFSINCEERDGFN